MEARKRVLGEEYSETLEAMSQLTDWWIMWDRHKNWVELTERVVKATTKSPDEDR